MDYITYLHIKLYLIECVCRHEIVQGNSEYKKILDIIMASPSEIKKLKEKLSEF